MKVLLISILVLLVITIVLGFVLLNGIKNLIQLMSSFTEVTANNFVTVDNSVHSCEISSKRIENKVDKLSDKIDTVQDTLEVITPLCRNGYPKLDEIIENTKPKPRKTKKTSEK